MYIDPVAGTVVGIVAGWTIGRLSRRPKQSPGKPDNVATLICSCKHGYGVHKEPDGCGADIKRARKWDLYGDTIGYEWVRCPCHAYDGPEPLPKIWTGGSNDLP